MQVSLCTLQLAGVLRGLQAAAPAHPTCPDFSTKLCSRYHLHYRAVALLAWFTKPYSGALKIKQEPIFILFSEERAAFSLLENNGSACTVSSAIGRLCCQLDPWDSVLSPHLGSSTGRQVQLLALPEGHNAQPAKVKADPCPSPQPLPAALLLQGKLLLDGEHWGGGRTSAPDGNTPSYCPLATARWREVAAGQQHGRVQKQARRPSWEASVQLWFCTRKITELTCLWGQKVCICILHLQALHLGFVCTEPGHKLVQKIRFTIGIVWLPYLLNFLLQLSPNFCKDGLFPCPLFSKHKTCSEMDCACLSLFQYKILSSSLLP